MESKNCLKFKTVATGSVICWAARRYVIHFNIGKRLRGFIALVSIPEYMRRWLLRLGLPVMTFYFVKNRYEWAVNLPVLFRYFPGFFLLFRAAWSG